MEKMIISMICSIVAAKLNRASVTIDEVQKIYDSGEYPEINAEIDYIIHG